MSKLKYYDGTDWKIVNGQVTGDTLPIGSEVDFDGQEVPAGWEETDETKIINGVFLYSTSGITSVNITSSNGYGRCIVIGSSFICSVQFNGTNTAPTLADLVGTNPFTASINGNVVTLSDLRNWDHYIFLGSSVITNIE